MIKYKFFLLISAFALFASCISIKTVSDAYEVIEVDNEVGQFNDTTYFRDFKMVCMENNPKYVLKDIGRIIDIKDTLYILNRGRDEVLVIDKEGNYIREIRKQGRGHGEYIQLIDFAYDESTDELLFLIAPTSILRYKRDGSFVSKQPLTEYYSDLSCDGKYIYLSRHTYIEKTHAEYNIDAISLDDGKTCHILSFDTEYAPFCSLGNTIFNTCNTISFVRKFDTNIYKINNGDITFHSQINIGDKQLKPKTNDELYDCSELTNICIQKKKIYGFSQVVHYGKFLMFSSNIWDIFIKNGKSLSNYSMMKNTKFNIPLKMFLPIEGMADYKVCFVMQQSEINSLKHLLKSNSNLRVKTHPDFVKTIERLPEETNPILFLYKIK